MRTGTPLREGDVLTQVRDYLRIQGWFVVRIHQTLGCRRGMPDLIAVKQGRVLWIECKSPLGQQSMHQMRFQADLEAHGGEYVLVRSVEDLQRYLLGEAG